MTKDQLKDLIFTGTTSTKTHPRDCWRRLWLAVSYGIVSKEEALGWYKEIFGEAEVHLRAKRSKVYKPYVDAGLAKLRQDRENVKST